MEPKMYVLTRMDLEPTYRIVQGSHALAQYSLDHSALFQKWGNQTIVYLGVWFPGNLLLWKEKLQKSGKYFSCFYEPDQEDQITAIACYDTGEIFKSLSLAR